MVTFEVTDHVRETIQQTLYRLQAKTGATSDVGVAPHLTQHFVPQID